MITVQTIARFFGIGALLTLLAACGGGGGGGGNDDVSSPANNPGNYVPSKDLPKVYVDTAGSAPVVSTEDEIDASVRITTAGGERLLQTSTEIRGRGNTTWGYPKKPYRLKFDEAAPVLGMPANRDWNLLANYIDKSLIRNKLAMNLGEKVGLSYSPRSVFVEFYFNGEYQGIYQISETVEESPNRVNITSLDSTDKDPNTITGGYLLEVDHRFDEEVCWFTTLNVPICSKDPEFKQEDIADTSTGSYLQYNYITNYINSAEQSLSASGNTYLNYFDADAMVKWYLVNELLKNNDAQINSYQEDSYDFTSSVFFYKQRGGKLTFGPLWDFDLAGGNINYNGNDNPTGWWIRNSEWHSRLFANTDFGRRVFTQWCTLVNNGTINGLENSVDSIVTNIDSAAIDRNFARWKILGTNVDFNSFIGQTHQEEVDYLKSWLSQRAAWMNAEFVREFGQCPAS